MTDKELLYIKTIAEERSVSAAAKKLFMTQPALSHCLRSLEREMGAPLFIRSPAGLDMTYAGECYYAMAMDILDIYNDYQQKLVDISEMKRGRVRIGMTRYITAMLIHQILPEFSSKYPMIEIQTEEKNSADLELDIAARKIDFAVIHGFDSLEDRVVGNIEYEVLNKDDFCLVMKKDTEYAKLAMRTSGYRYPVLDPKCLEDEPFILETQSHRMRVVIDNIFKRVNIEPKVILETTLFQTAQNLAGAGYGITIVNERYIKEFTNIDDYAIFSIPKKYKPYWTMSIIKTHNGYMPSASQMILDVIREKEKKK